MPASLAIPAWAGVTTAKTQFLTDTIFISKRTRLPNRKHESKRTKPASRRKSTRTSPKKSVQAPKTPALTRQERKEQGLCRCGQATIQGQTRCPACAEKHREWNQLNSEKRRIAKGIEPRPPISAESIEQIREEIAALDARRASTTPRKVGSAEQNEVRQKHRAQVRAERKSLGQCVRCGKPSDEGQTRCADCVLKHRQYGLRSRVKAKLTSEQ